jgi:2-polyprenyl-3-methyl-5-hydroxy-6-metoxy-1,4-benzoquinol methylase
MFRQDWDKFWGSQRNAFHHSADPVFSTWFSSELKLILPELQGRSVLENGCGSGQLYTQLGFDKAGAYRGTDLSETMLETFREKFPGVDLVCARAENYLSDKKYDLIFCNDMIQYLDYRRLDRLFGNSTQMLAPRGFLTLSMIPWAAQKFTYQVGDMVPKASLPARALRVVKSALGNSMANWHSWAEIRRLAAQYGLDAFFYGSLSYPYRFHVVLARLKDFSGVEDKMLHQLLVSRRA